MDGRAMGGKEGVQRRTKSMAFKDRPSPKKKVFTPTKSVLDERRAK